MNLAHMYGLSDLYLSSIGVMEDDSTTLQLIAESLQNFGLKRIDKIDSAENALKLAEKSNLRCFILDINMGSQRAQEGLDALEMLKDYDSNLFVALLSAYNGKYVEMARRLNVNIFKSKTSNRQADVREIIRELIEHLRENIEHVEWSIIEDNPSSSRSFRSSYDDPNYIEYKKLLIDPQWFKTHQGLYVGFVEGNFITSSDDKQNLLHDLGDKFPDRPKFVTKVEGYEDIIDLPSPYIVSEGNEQNSC